MKKAKPVLFVLAGLWLLLMLIEKLAGTADAITVRKKAWPVKAGHHGLRALKSILLIGLAVINIFMALSLIGGAES